MGGVATSSNDECIPVIQRKKLVARKAFAKADCSCSFSTTSTVYSLGRASFSRPRIVRASEKLGCGYGMPCSKVYRSMCCFPTWLHLPDVSDPNVPCGEGRHQERQ